jgi:hypothetical protein
MYHGGTNIHNHVSKKFCPHAMFVLNSIVARHGSIFEKLYGNAQFIDNCNFQTSYANKGITGIKHIMKQYTNTNIGITKSNEITILNSLDSICDTTFDLLHTSNHTIPISYSIREYRENHAGNMIVCFHFLFRILFPSTILEKEIKFVFDTIL